MAEYAILKDGALVKFVDRDEAPEMAAHKGYSALPVVREATDTSTLPVYYTVGSATHTIEPTRYLITTTKRDMNAQELAAYQETVRTQVMQRLDADDDLIKALGKVMFDMVNEIRELKSQPPLTGQQFRDYVKGKF